MTNTIINVYFQLYLIFEGKYIKKHRYRLQSTPPFHLSCEGRYIENTKKNKFSYKVKVKSHFVRANTKELALRINLEKLIWKIDKQLQRSRFEVSSRKFSLKSQTSYQTQNLSQKSQMTFM